MKVEIKTPQITEYRFIFDKNDEIFKSCMWTKIHLDHENYVLSTTGDCGNYLYGWVPTPNSESFIELMSRVDEYYLLNKISSRSVFMLEESKKKTIENLRYCAEYEDDTTLDEITAQINEIDSCGDETFYYLADGIIGDYSECIEVAKDYPRMAKTFCRIFVQYLQPILREEVK